jgi:riboflavin synthase
MFTGIIEELGTVDSLSRKSDTLRIGIKADKILEGISVGDSIAINGACLTVVKLTGGVLLFDVMKETLNNTTFRSLKIKDRVNLERPLKLTSFLSGHLVSGHIDCVGFILNRTMNRDEAKIDIRVNKDMAGYIIPKGSIAVDGVSLTVADIAGDVFSVCLIPLTRAMTTLEKKRIKDSVNIEVDIIGKYVKSILSKSVNKETLTEEFLKERGFL